jgi:hypothetical protein
MLTFIKEPFATADIDVLLTMLTNMRHFSLIFDATQGRDHIEGKIHQKEI